MSRDGSERATLSSKNSLDRKEEHNANCSWVILKHNALSWLSTRHHHLGCHQTVEIHCTVGYNLFGLLPRYYTIGKTLHTIVIPRYAVITST